MKKVLLLFIGVFMILVTAACSDNASSTKEKKKSNKVTVYSPHQAEIINPIIKEFQDRTKIEVELVTSGTGELLNRLKAESDNPLGDVFWGGGAESIEAFKENFEPYKPKDDDKIPNTYKSTDNSWIGFSALPMVIMYNKDMVKENEVPGSWNDLLNSKWKGKIAFADPSKSGSSYTQLVTMLTANKDDGKNGWDYVSKFVKNLDGKVLGGSSMVYKGIADGEFPVGITLEEAAYRYISGGANVGVIYPSEGTSAVPDGMALIKGAKNKENAQKFLDFLASKDVQELIVKEFNRRSVREDVEGPNGLTPSKEIPLVDYDFNWASSNQDDVMKKFKDLVIGK
ncbi:ABC transporter substrate-binding protein [Heyndrickxia oleronia]|mgnify:CR=1 FL=1|uniref:ABC transporter substrate-binding protein n=1 Tax=Heyndrickxia oleronia TaxID=38875 RepID=UPI001B24C2B9|nr:ABC transporter substrate-binding protein [Heyndrickxia oleronia]GIN39880.1 ABC transporter substrate-binding protein [Heyndrickxia oleronia]